MAFQHAMYPPDSNASNYGFTVDSMYQSLVQENLFYNSIFQPGATYSGRYEMGPAGQIFVHKLTSTPVKLGYPGDNFTHEDTKDSIIAIQVNNTFSKSRIMRGIQNVAVAYPVVATAAKLATKEVKEGWNLAGLACLITEGIGNTVKMESLNESNIKKAILDAKTYMSKKKTRPQWVLCPPDTYQIVLEAAGKWFTPVTNDRMVTSAIIGQWLGVNFLECNLMQSGSALGTDVAYRDYTGTVKKVADEIMGKINFIMYDYEALSIVTNFEVVRTAPAVDFVGSYLQVTINSGYRVTEQYGVCVSVNK